MSFHPGAGIAISSSPGSVIMPSTKGDQREACICGSKLCKKLTKCFKSIGDIRGRFFQNPAFDCTRCGDIKQFKLDRTCKHLNVTLSKDELIASRDLRDRNNILNTPSNKTRSNSKKSKKGKRTYVAYHHFHPEILQEAVIKQESATIDFIDSEFVKQCGIFGYGYTNEDKFKGTVTGVSGDVFVPVPSYKHAQRDYEMASTRFRLHDMIRTCTNKFRGESFITWKENGRGFQPGEDEREDPLQPVSKLRQMDRNNVKDLQRAVCLLSDRVSE